MEFSNHNRQVKKIAVGKQLGTKNKDFWTFTTRLWFEYTKTYQLLRHYAKSVFKTTLSFHTKLWHFFTRKELPISKEMTSNRKARQKRRKKINNKLFKLTKKWNNKFHNITMYSICRLRHWVICNLKKPWKVF